MSSSTSQEISEDLVPALIKCFGIIFIGYIFGRFEILQNLERKGIGIFVQNLSLPILIFKLTATISFDNVNWTFVASVFIAKAIMFVLVALLCMVLIKPAHVGKAGLYAILATQSNDFALGIPLLLSLYEKTHSSYASVLYLAPSIQILIINPVGFFMLEIYKQREDTSPVKRNSFISIIKGIFSNPIVAMTVLGIIWNFTYGHTVPLPFGQLVDALSAAFPATALLLLGHSMVGKIGTFRGHFALAPTLLILAKILILPIILQKIVVLLSNGLSAQDTEDLGNLGFLYGAIPCGPAVFVFACQYGISVDVVTATIVFSTLFSAPIMFVSATLATLSLHGLENLAPYMESAISYISLISLISCLWLLVMFIIGKRWFEYSGSYGVTTYLVLAQLITSVGGILYFFNDTAAQSILYAQYILTSGGILSTRIWTVFLAVLLLLLRWRNLHFIRTEWYVINVAGFVASFGVAFTLSGCLLIYETPTAGESPNFPLGHAQILLTAVTTLLCLVITTVCLIFQHKYRRTSSSSTDSEPSTPIDGRGQIINKTENDSWYCGGVVSHRSGDPLYQNFCDHCLNDNAQIRTSIHSDADQHQYDMLDAEESERILRHIMLLIVISFSMLISLAVCLWELIKESVDGIFLELEFSDVVLNYGLGIIYFLIFGLDITVIRPFMKFWGLIHQCWKSVSPAQNSLSSETQLLIDDSPIYVY